MPKRVDAVIAALRIALQEAEKGSGLYWKAKAANRWIDRLPGAWMGRWRHLRLRGDHSDNTPRTDFIGHVRATLAYLEANRDAALRHWTWPFAVTARPPINTQFKVGGSRWQSRILRKHGGSWAPRRIDLLVGDARDALPAILLAGNGDRVADRLAGTIDEIETAVPEADDNFPRSKLRAEADDFAPAGIALVSAAPVPKNLSCRRTRQGDR